MVVLNILLLPEDTIIIDDFQICEYFLMIITPQVRYSSAYYLVLAKHMVWW
jgi:hypothetical protein